MYYCEDMETPASENERKLVRYTYVLYTPQTTFLFFSRNNIWRQGSRMASQMLREKINATSIFEAKAVDTVEFL
jgi:hypothetical protein